MEDVYILIRKTVLCSPLSIFTLAYFEKNEGDRVLAVNCKNPHRIQKEQLFSWHFLPYVLSFENELSRGKMCTENNQGKKKSLTFTVFFFFLRSCMQHYVNLFYLRRKIPFFKIPHWVLLKHQILYLHAAYMFKHPSVALLPEYSMSLDEHGKQVTSSSWTSCSDSHGPACIGRDLNTCTHFWLVHKQVQGDVHLLTTLDGLNSETAARRTWWFKPCRTYNEASLNLVALRNPTPWLTPALYLSFC